MITHNFKFCIGELVYVDTFTTRDDVSDLSKEPNWEPAIFKAVVLDRSLVEKDPSGNHRAILRRTSDNAAELVEYYSLMLYGDIFEKGCRLAEYFGDDLRKLSAPTPCFEKAEGV